MKLSYKNKQREQRKKNNNLWNRKLWMLKKLRMKSRKRIYNKKKKEQ